MVVWIIQTNSKTPLRIQKRVSSIVLTSKRCIDGLLSFATTSEACLKANFMLGEDFLPYSLRSTLLWVLLSCTRCSIFWFCEIRTFQVLHLQVIFLSVCVIWTKLWGKLWDKLLIKEIWNRIWIMKTRNQALRAWF